MIKINDIDGRQLWAEINPDNCRIRNCGFNEPGSYRVWIKDTGFQYQSILFACVNLLYLLISDELT